MTLPGIQKAEDIQLGAQATFDTAVPATFRYPGDLTFTEQHSFYEPNYPLHIRGQIAGQLVAIMNGFAGSWKSELTFEEIILFLAAGLKGGVTPTVANVTENTWVFTPPVAGDPAPSYITAEFAVDNWSTKWGRQVPNVLVPKLHFGFKANQVVEFQADLFGGAIVPAFTPTTSLVNMTGRELASSNKLSVAIDTSGASLGNTVKTGRILQVDLDIETGLKPDYTVDGRANIDYSHYIATDLLPTLKVVTEYTADADAEFSAWRAKTARFIRLQVTGSTIASNPKKIMLDGCYEYVKEPVISRQNGLDIVTFEAKGKYDATWAKILNATVVNAIASLT